MINNEIVHETFEFDTKTRAEDIVILDPAHEAAIVYEGAFPSGDDPADYFKVRGVAS